MVALAGLLVSCERSHPPAPDSNFEKLLQASRQELIFKTAAQTTWGFGSLDNWDLNQDAGVLAFSNKDGMTAICPAQVIGTYDRITKTWLWAWDDSSVADRLKTDARRMKAYGTTNHLAQLTTPEWRCEESDAWSMAALAVKLCGSQGAYCGPAGTTYVFITFGPVTLRKTR